MATGAPTITFLGRSPRRVNKAGPGVRVGHGTIVFSTASNYAVSGITRAFRDIDDILVQLSGPYVAQYVRSSTDMHAGLIKIRRFSTGALGSPASTAGLFTAFGK